MPFHKNSELTSGKKKKENKISKPDCFLWYVWHIFLLVSFAATQTVRNKRLTHAMKVRIYIIKLHEHV